MTVQRAWVLLPMDLNERDKEDLVRFLNVLLVCVIAVVMMGIGTPSVTAQEPVPEAPKPTVPGIFTLQGEFTRIGYNNEGWVTLGFRNYLGPCFIYSTAPIGTTDAGGVGNHPCQA